MISLLAIWLSAAALPPLADASVQPAVMPRDAQGVQWRRYDGALFRAGGPLAGDVAQHGAGDCYLMATLSELARMRPDLIRRAMRGDDGALVVRFFDAPVRGDVPTGPLSPVEVHIDRQLPVKGRLLAYGNRGASLALWPEYMEKAWAKLHGGYEAIGHGGNAANVMRALAGGAPTTVHVPDADPTALLERLRAATARHELVVAGTIHAPPRDGPPLQGDHAYSVLAVRTDAHGANFVALRNPFGGPTLELRMRAFVRAFSNVALSGPLPPERWANGN